jgi:UDP-N-acetylmuramate--alanine ligase
MSFGDMGQFDPNSRYFIYEADEFDRNFLAFQPKLAIITGIDYDHHDIYPTRKDYEQAFNQFISQSQLALLWKEDFEKLGLAPSPQRYTISKNDPRIRESLSLPGIVNREDAWEVAAAVELLTQVPVSQLLGHLDTFPGVSRRFEKLVPGLYTDYAHTAPKIRGTLQTAREVAGEKKVIAVYEGLHNTRQHFMKHELSTLFDSADFLYIVPTFLAREDKTLPLMTPESLRDLLSDKTKSNATASALDETLEKAIRGHIDAGDIVVCMSAGSAGSLDEWLRSKFTPATKK